MQGGLLFAKRILLAALFFCAAFAPAPRNADAQQNYDVIVQNGVPMKTRDGVTLFADIYRPKAEGKFPVILMRTPYDKSAAGPPPPPIKSPARLRHDRARRSRPLHLRRRVLSFRHESPDGYDTVEWAAALPYSNGKVGMIGGSYVGATQMLAAIAHPPHLAGICPVVTASNYHDGLDLSRRRVRAMVRSKLDDATRHQYAVATYRKEHQCAGGHATLPLTQYPRFNYAALPAGAESTQELAPYYLDWLAHPDYDSLLEAMVHRGTFCGYPSSRAAYRRLVRHFSHRHAAQLSWASKRTADRKPRETGSDC